MFTLTWDCAMWKWVPYSKLYIFLCFGLTWMFCLCETQFWMNWAHNHITCLRGMNVLCSVHAIVSSATIIHCPFFENRTNLPFWLNNIQYIGWNGDCFLLHFIYLWVTLSRLPCLPILKLHNSHTSIHSIENKTEINGTFVISHHQFHRNLNF